MRALILAALLVAACKKDEAAKPAPAPVAGSAAAAPAEAPAKALSVDEAGAQAMALFGKIAAAVTAGGDDCAKIAANLTALKPDLQRLVADGRDFDKDPVKKKAFDEKYGDQLRAVIAPTQAPLSKCQGNADIAAFFSAME